MIPFSELHILTHGYNKYKNLSPLLHLLKLTLSNRLFKKEFQQFYLGPNPYLIKYYTPNSRILEELFTKSQPSFNQIRICLPFKLFYAAFDETHSHDCSEEKLFIKTSSQFCCIPNSPLSFFVFSFMIVLNVKQTNTALLNLPQNLVTDRSTEYIVQDMTHFALALLLNTLHVLHILLGQMVQLKFKIIILEPIFVFFLQNHNYQLVISISNSMPTLTTLLLFLSLNFL